MTAIESILQSPQANRIAIQLTSVLANEAARRATFLDEVDESTKSEWINGEPIVHSPVKLRHYSRSFRTLKLIDAIVQKSSPGGLVGHEKLMVHLTRNDYEPDVCYWRAEVARTFKPDQMLFPAPDMVVEVLSESTQAVDRGVKFEDYAAHGVREYWIIDPGLTPNSQSVEQYLLTDANVFELKIKSSNGSFVSPVLGGAPIDIAAILND